MPAWPISFDDIRAARGRLAPYLPATPLRGYAMLDQAVGGGVRVLVKHENHQPTNAFKVRNALSAITALGADARRRGVVAASTGNHGQGLAYAGALLGVRVTICVPVGNNPEKNASILGYGARLVEDGASYDDATDVAQALAEREGLHVVHSTNDRDVVAGASTMSMEILEQAPELDAMVVAVGGGSQVVGALTVARTLRPALRVYGVQAAGAPAIHDSWRARRPLRTATADTFAEGIATRGTYELTFETMLEGLTGFVTVSDDEMAAAIRLLISTTHNLAEGAGAAGLAGLLRLREELAGQTVAIVLSGSNIDAATLRRVVKG